MVLGARPPQIMRQVLKGSVRLAVLAYPAVAYRNGNGPVFLLQVSNDVCSTCPPIILPIDYLRLQEWPSVSRRKPGNYANLAMDMAIEFLKLVCRDPVFQVAQAAHFPNFKAA